MRRATADGSGVRRGDFLVNTGVPVVREIASATGVDFTPLGRDPSGFSEPLTRQRIGTYQRYYGGNMDEGWTRLLLEQFGFAYTTLMDDEITRGNLHERWDVIILPDDSKQMMLGPEGRTIRRLSIGAGSGRPAWARWRRSSGRVARW